MDLQVPRVLAGGLRSDLIGDAGEVLRSAEAKTRCHVDVDKMGKVAELIEVGQGCVVMDREIEVVLPRQIAKRLREDAALEMQMDFDLRHPGDELVECIGKSCI